MLPGGKTGLGQGFSHIARAHSVRKKTSREGRSYPGAYHKKLDKSDNIEGIFTLDLPSSSFLYTAITFALACHQLALPVTRL